MRCECELTSEHALGLHLCELTNFLPLQEADLGVQSLASVFSCLPTEGRHDEDQTRLHPLCRQADLRNSERIQETLSQAY